MSIKELESIEQPEAVELAEKVEFERRRQQNQMVKMSRWIIRRDGGYSTRIPKVSS